MAQPTSSLSRFVGPVYTGTTPPTAAIIGKPLEAGMIYIDIESPHLYMCAYDGSAWQCSPEWTAAAGTSTSTTTSTTTTTTTSTSTTTTAT